MECDETDIVDGSRTSIWRTKEPSTHRKTWWWNEDAAEAIEEKRRLNIKSQDRMQEVLL